MDVDEGVSLYSVLTDYVHDKYKVKLVVFVVSGWEQAAQKGSKPEGPGRTKCGPVLAQEPGTVPKGDRAAQNWRDETINRRRHGSAYSNCKNSNHLSRNSRLGQQMDGEIEPLQFRPQKAVSRSLGDRPDFLMLEVKRQLDEHPPAGRSQGVPHQPVSSAWARRINCETNGFAYGSGKIAPI